MGMALAIKRGEKVKATHKQKLKKVAHAMSEADLADFARRVSDV